MPNYLDLKLIGEERLSNIDNHYHFDSGFGIFTGLNALPKPTTISTCSYNVDAGAIHSFMMEFVSKVNSLDSNFKEFRSKL